MRYIHIFYLLVFILILSCGGDEGDPIQTLNFEDQDFSINENPNAGDIIGTIAGESDTYQLVSQSSQNAVVLNDKNELVVETPEVFNYEEIQSLSVKIRDVTLDQEAEMTINVLNLEDEWQLVDEISLGSLRVEEMEMSDDGSTIAFGFIDDANSENGVLVFGGSNDSWEQIGGQINENQVDNNFGRSLGLNSSGNRIAIGAPNHDWDPESTQSKVGYISVYDFTDNEWVSNSSLEGDEFHLQLGTTLDISADGLFLASGNFGSPQSATGDHVAFYSILDGKLTNENTNILAENIGDQTGYSMEMNDTNDVIVIGANSSTQNGTFTGSARVFKKTGDAWAQVGITQVGSATFEFYGRSVAINDAGDIIAIGATGTKVNGNNSGTIQVFDITDNNLTMTKEFHGEENDRFAWSVDLSGSGDVMIVGNQGGYARIYNLNEEQEPILLENENSEFGKNVFLSKDGKTAAVSFEGGAFIYRLL